MSMIPYISTNARPCASCGRTENCLESCIDRWYPVPVSPGAPVSPVQMRPERRSRSRRVPVGGIVLVFLGMALMGIGFVLNEPVSWLIYHQIHK